MTPKERAAMQQALRTFEELKESYGWEEDNEAITALREALAEQAEQYKCRPEPPFITRLYAPQLNWKAKKAEQEPVGTARELFTMSALERLDVRPSTKVYLDTAPVRTKDLTDDELNALWHNTKGGWLGLFRAVIAAYKEKNK